MINKKLYLEKTYDHSVSDTPKLTVVLIHGIASDSSTFTDFLKYLSEVSDLKSVRFVTFDLLGSGKSLRSDDLNYDYDEQLTALDNSIRQLNSKEPVVLVGHSLGTFITTRFTSGHMNLVKRLILISPPIFTVQDLENPAFKVALETFKNVIGAKSPEVLKEKSFNNSMEKIVLDKNNYQTLAEIKVPTELIYGEGDQLIASYNVPRILKDNPEYIKATKTDGRHGVTPDKYPRIVEILEEILNAKDI